MTAAPLAHVSHWLVNVLYLVPLVIVVVMLGVAMVRDRRAEAAEADEARRVRRRTARRPPARRPSTSTPRRSAQPGAGVAVSRSSSAMSLASARGVRTLVANPTRWRPRASSSTVDAECSIRSVCGCTP